MCEWVFVNGSINIDIYRRMYLLCKCWCIYVCTLIYTYVYVCTWVYTYVSVCSGGYWVYIYIYLYVLVACHGISDLFGEIQTSCRRPGPDPNYVVVDPTHRRFEDRCIGWSVDQCQFMQWRPDGDSVPKPRHFMWVFVLVYLSLMICFTCCLYHFMWLFVILY